MENRRSRLLFQQPWFENHGHHLFHHFSRSRFMISLVGWSKNWFTDPAANVVNCPRERNEVTTGSLRNDRDKFRPQPLQHPLSDDQFPSHHPSINWSTLSLFFPREPSRSLQRELTRRPWTRNFSIAPKFYKFFSSRNSICPQDYFYATILWGNLAFTYSGLSWLTYRIGCGGTKLRKSLDIHWLNPYYKSYKYINTNRHVI